MGKRLLLSLTGGVAFQGLILIIGWILDAPVLVLIFLLPGWAAGFAGRDSDQSWSGLIFGWLVMLSINNLFYSAVIYFLLWRREVQKDIRDNDLDSFIKKPGAGRLSIK